MLAGPGFGDNARFAHPPREQDLADAIVDLVRAGVQQVLALEIDFGAAQLAGEPLGKIQRRGASAEFTQIISELFQELRVVLGPGVLVLELLQRMHERLRNEAPAIGTEMTERVRHRFNRH